MSGQSRQNGFTLIEVAIALIVLGLLMVPFIQQYNSYRVNKAIKDTTGNIIVVKTALQKFALKYGRYPIPAQPSLANTNAGYGREFTAAIAACAANTGNVCQVAGYRDRVTPTGNDPVYIGTVPFATLGLPELYSRDGYGFRLTYAVTASQTSNATFKDDNGVIRIVQRDGSLTDNSNDSVHYVIVSHGPDGVGAVTPGGTYSSNCPAAGASADQQNCNKDAIFNDNFAAFGVAPDIVRSRYVSYPTSAQHYDDFLGYTTTTTTDLWARVANSSNIFARNTGNVRVGQLNVTPVTKLDVMGNTRADRVSTNRLCNVASCATAGSTSGLVSPNAFAPKVFTPSILGGDPNEGNAGKLGGGVLCATNTPMTGIQNADEICNFKPAISVTGCTTAGTYSHGTTSTGALFCN